MRNRLNIEHLKVYQKYDGDIDGLLRNNQKAEIVAVVFAGRGGLSYGFLVPFEHVKQFLDQEEVYFTKIIYDTQL